MLVCKMSGHLLRFNLTCHHAHDWLMMPLCIVEVVLLSVAAGVKFVHT